MADLTHSKASIRTQLQTLCQSKVSTIVDDVPIQVVPKTMIDGFTFNILCVGRTACGKSSFIESLFNVKLNSKSSTHDQIRVDLKHKTFDFSENGIHLKLTVTESSGFGDQIDTSDSFRSIADYIDQQFQLYLNEEMRIQRNLSNYRDTRVHVCLYFLNPNGHSIKELDLLTMKCLDSKVNLIPLIAKADTLTKSEIERFRETILEQLRSFSIDFYRFPIDDQIVGQDNVETNNLFPLAIVGSHELIKIGHQYLRARQYPWGVVQVANLSGFVGLFSQATEKEARSDPIVFIGIFLVENEEHCDMKRLRRSLIQNNILDLIESTHFKHYETFRHRRLIEVSPIQVIDEKPMSIIDVMKIREIQLHEEFQRREKQLQIQYNEKFRNEEQKFSTQKKNIDDHYATIEKTYKEQIKIYEDKIRLLTEELNVAQDPKRTINKDTSKKNSKK